MSLFKKIINKEIPAHILYEDEEVFAFLDISQTTKGHTLIIPKVETKNFLETDSQLIGKMFKVTQQLAKKIQENLGATGFNVLTNMNEVAGQTVFHFHIHLIPRYDENDTLKIEFSSNELDLNEIKTMILKNQD
jgi:histidine triad (HIT) family protein